VESENLAFDALSDRVRRRILSALGDEGELTVTDITDGTSNTLMVAERCATQAGDFPTGSSMDSDSGEAVLNNLQEAGIRVKLRPLERAAFFAAYSEKKLKNIIQGASGAFGNAATRLEAFAVKGGAYAYGNYPEIDTLFAEQATEIDVAKRTAMLHRIQQILHEKSVYAPIWQLAFINGQGKRVGESGLGLIRGHAYSAPYEDVTIKQT